MLDAPRLEALAEAVADGRDSDWAAAESSAIDADERETVAQLRAIASIGQVFTSLSSDGHRLPPSRAILANGDTWGPLRVLDHVGRGRFGDVYRAWDPALDREVALKLISTHEAGAGDVVDEGRLMARVHHPNVVSIFGAQRIGAITGLWMQFVRGRTLADELAATGPLSGAELVRVGQAVAAALNAVHEAGLVHRDVKAQNVLRDERGQILLGDFGTGREMDTVTDSGGLAGTPMYLAPELFVGGAPSRQSDIYGLGTLLFHLATGEFPVTGRSLAALRDAHTRGQRRLLRTTRVDLPAPLAAAVDRALDPDPARRFADAAAMSAALAPAPLPVRKGISRRGLATAATLAVATIALIASVARAPETAAIPFAARDWVLVTPFDNRTSDPLFDGTLEHILERELTNSSHVNVVPRLRVQDTLELMRKPADSRIDAGLAREVAVRDGQIRLLLAGRLEKLGTRYLLSVQAVNPVDGTAVASLAEDARSQDDLLRAVRVVASRLRVSLGETLASVRRSTQTLMKATTPSLRALQLFSAGVDRVDNETTAYNPRIAEDLFRQAVAEDPQFATAHAFLAVMLSIPATADQAVFHARQALALADQASHREQGHIIARAHSVLSRWEPASAAQHERQFADALETHLQFYPDDVDAMRGLAIAYRTQDRPDEAAAMLLRVAALRPTSVRAQLAGARAHVERGQLEDARTLVDRVRGLNLPLDRLSPGDTAWLLTFHAQAAWLDGDPAAAAHELDRLAADASRHPADLRAALELSIVSLFMTLGQLDRAEQVLTSSVGRSDHDWRIAGVLSAREDTRRLRQHLLERFSKPDMANRVGSLWIEAGLLAEARAVVARAPQNQLYAGQLALTEGRLQEAIERLGPLARRAVQPSIGGPAGWRAIRKFAEALSADGRTEEAIAALESGYTRRWASEGGVSGGSEWLRLVDTLAQQYRKAGQIAQAEAVEAELRKLLAVADEDHPIKRRIQ